ncbi:AMP-binding protein [Bombella sp. TMW 2.2559]|uniref:AMP-binding protein n=1 Tax=Bombella dulcis TaxID=2967339 RepID=A0ABT3WC53_9PROT|nr:AMP-binding protein [Bombella dulcis]MCX5616531.1 AMP-binding protein [Bombella dulcis]
MGDVMSWTFRKVKKFGYSVEEYNNGFTVLDRNKSRLDEILSFRALDVPDQVQFVMLDQNLDIEGSLTFYQAHEWACRVAGLLDQFLAERSRVILCFENEMAAVAGFFGCVYANMIPISGVYPSMVGSVDRLSDILEDSEATAVLGSRDILKGFRRQVGSCTQRIKWVPIEGADGAQALYRRHAAGLDDIAFVQYTSGSTGRPRGALITHRNIGSNLYLLEIRGDSRAGSLGLIWLPLSHDMGLVSLLFGVATGSPVWLMKPEHFIAKPERWVQAISRYRINVSAGPNFAYELLASHVPDSMLRGLDLTCWKRSFIGAEAIEQRTVERFFERYGPLGVKRSILRPGYGMAETTLMITSDDWADEKVVRFEAFSRMGLAEGRVELPRNEYDKRILASCGRVIEEHSVLVVDPDTGEALPEGQVGELWLNGPSVTLGYLNREQENRERFSLRAEGGRWFRSRDAGFFWQGRLFVTGRMDNSLFIGGQCYDPDDLTQAVRQDCHIFSSRSVAVFRHENVLCILGEVSLAQVRQDFDFEGLLMNMARAVARVCPVRLVRCVLVRPGGIYHTPSGKIRLAATSEALKEGRLPVLDEKCLDARELGGAEILALGAKPL